MTDGEQIHTDEDSLTSKSLSINIRNVSKRISSSFEIQNVSIDVKPGEFFSLLGPSGSGKSTLLGLIGGWIAPQSGQIFLGNREYTSVPAYERPIRTCFQAGGYLFPHMNVQSNIGYALRVKRINRDVISERVDEVMQQVGLSGFGKRMPSQLSGGEAQRVAIARALADSQPILLLDEIQTGLDRHLRASIRDLLVELTTRLCLTSVYVTHDASEALGLASRLHSRLGILNRGDLVQVGTAEEIYYKPRTSFIASLMGEVNLFTVAVEANGILSILGRTLLGPAHENLGSPRYVAVRPEAIAVHRPSERHVSFAGKVESVEFLGAVTRIFMRVQKDLVIMQQFGMDKPLSVGQMLPCYIRWTDILPLDE
jgi:ABC-type Fe3+/spermidine/putrescine transport system ATPase subunit